MQITSERNIRPAQFFSVLLLCRLLINLTFDPNGLHLAPTDKIISDILTAVFMFIFSVPAFLFIRKGEGLYDSAKKVSIGGCKFIGFLYGLYFIFWSAITVSRFQIFATSFLETGFTQLFFVLMIVASACYAAYLGINALSRASLVMMFIVGAAVVMLFFIPIKKFDFLNLGPIFYDGCKIILQDAVYSASSSVEIAALTLFVSRVDGNVKKGYIITLILFLAFALLISTPACLVIGDLMPKLLFPEYILATMSEVGVFQSMDALITGAWILGAFVKTAFMILLSLLSFSQSLEIKKRTLWIIGISAAVAALGYLFSVSVASFADIIRGDIFVILSLVFIIIIPFGVLTADKIRLTKLERAEGKI